MAIKPSFIQRATEYFKCTASVSNPSDVFNSLSNEAPSGELARTNDTTTQINRIIPPLVGELMKFLRIFSIKLSSVYNQKDKDRVRK